MINTIDMPTIVAPTDGGIQVAGGIDSSFQDTLFPKIGDLLQKDGTSEMSGSIKIIVEELKEALINAQDTELEEPTSLGDAQYVEKIKNELNDILIDTDKSELPLIYQLQNLISAYQRDDVRTLTSTDPVNTLPASYSERISLQLSSDHLDKSVNVNSTYEQPVSIELGIKNPKEAATEKMISVAGAAADLLTGEKPVKQVETGDPNIQKFDVLTRQPVSAVISQNGTVVPNPTATHSVIAAQVGTPEWEIELGQRLTIFTRDGFQNAELRLNPAELGSIKINLQIKNDVADIHFITEHQHVRAALETAIPQLRSSLDQSGITLGMASMEHDSNHTQGHHQDFAGTRDPDWHDEEQGDGDNPVEGETVSISRGISMTGIINTYA
jgi:flagellar hook-length control protein FliK